MGSWGILALLLALGLACAGEEPLPDVASQRFAATVGDYVATGCSTAVVDALSRQIADEVNCMAPGALTTIEEGDGIDFNYAHVLPYVTPEAKQAMRAAVNARGGTLRISSLYRTVAQQYLLYRWWQQGRCGITAAATPGNSNHESGRAVDVSNYGDWITALGNRGWSHSVPGDPVHFDHVSSPDLRGMDVHAFQRLWNRNHPDDPIAEDGDYGPQTAARLARAPAEGFPIGACPGGGGGDTLGAEARGAEAPETLIAGERAAVWVELENTGSTPWTPATTFLGTTGPRDRESPFFDPEDWVGANRPSPVDQDTPPGAIGRFSFTLHAPGVNEGTSFVETFGLVQEGVAWFGPEDVTLEVLVSPTPEGESGGGTGEPEGGGGQSLGGGCAVAAGRRTGSPLFLALLCALLLLGPRACSLAFAGRREGNEQARTPDSPGPDGSTRVRLHRRQ